MQQKEVGNSPVQETSVSYKKEKSMSKTQSTKTKKNNNELAEEIVAMISNDINARSGLGTIWRQLNVDRKSEMLKKWKQRISEIL